MFQDCFTFNGYNKGAFPESEKDANETIALPIFPELAQNQISHIVQKIDDFFKEIK